MEKRVVIFLVLSLAIILGYDLLLKQMGWLPEPVPVQDSSARGSSSTEPESTPTGVAGENSDSPAQASPSNLVNSLPRRA